MDKELISILQLILNRILITLKELEEETGFTKRQITYRINKINDLLKEKKLPPISLSYKKGIILEAETKNALLEMIVEHESDKMYYLSKDERLAYMYLMMFIKQDYLTLNHIIDALKVSRSSVLLDFKELEQELLQNNIQIKNNRTFGYYLTGSEIDIRRYMMRVVINTLSNEHGSKIFDLFINDYQLMSFKESKEIILELSRIHDIKFVEDRLVEFIYILTILKARMVSENGTALEVPDIKNIEIMDTMKEYEYTVDLLSRFHDGAKINTFDVRYISAWILGISIGNADGNLKDAEFISDIVNKMITRFESLCGFHYGNYENIFKQLFSHFRPAYYRLLFKLPIYNPLCQKVKEEYRELFTLVSETIKPISAIFGQDIPEDEIAYLTLHFASIFSSHKDYTPIAKKTALVVCSNGIGSSAILYSELKALFPEIHFLLPIEAAKVSEVTEKIDIIFTTNFDHHIFENNIPVIKVSPVMNSTEKYQIAREVFMVMGNSYFKQPKIDEVMDIISKHTDIFAKEKLRNELLQYFSQVETMSIKENKELQLSDLTNKKLVQLHVRVNDWKEAIIKASLPLLQNNIIVESYIEEMIRITQESGPYFVITDNVALPHAKPSKGALECGIGITVLQEPIDFGDDKSKPVKYIFTLSAKDNESHIKAIAQLINLLEKEDFLQLLNNAEESEEIINYIIESETKELVAKI